MTLIWKNVYIDKLDGIVNKCNNTYHFLIEIIPFDVKSSTHIDSGTWNNDKSPKVKVGEHVKIWKYKNVFAKVYVPYWEK